jgi:hypothetical protein
MAKPSARLSARSGRFARQPADNAGVLNKVIGCSPPVVPLWFWAAVVIGLVIRIYLVLFTQGTYDIDIWQHHTAAVGTNGLLAHYRASPQMNHPPFISMVAGIIFRIQQAGGIPFAVLWRAPFALLDLGTAFLLLSLLRDNRHRFIITAGYWLCPLSMIFSGYHGNTDSSIAFFLMLCVYLLSKERTAWAGAALGVSLWVKLPAMLAIPAIVFWLPSWGRRLKFCAAMTLVACSTYLPSLWDDPVIVYNRVFAYQGQIIRTTADIPIWGTMALFRYLAGLPAELQSYLNRPITFYLKHNVPLCLSVIVFYSWLRRRSRSVHELGVTIAAVYTILYGLSNYWSFQYFAWSVPFWFFAGPYFVAPAVLLASAYIYGLYWFVCGNG